MNEELTQNFLWSGVLVLVVALFVRTTYIRLVRKRWPLVEATIDGIDGDIRVSASAEGALGIQPEYIHHILYKYNGIQHEVQLIHPQLHKGPIHLRVNPANPAEAYFNDDITQKATFVKRAS